MAATDVSDPWVPMPSQAASKQMEKLKHELLSTLTKKGDDAKDGLKRVDVGECKTICDRLCERTRVGPILSCYRSLPLILWGLLGLLGYIWTYCFYQLFHWTFASTWSAWNTALCISVNII